METQNMPTEFEADFKKLKSFPDEFKKGSQEIMTSSTASANSSLASPGDSGVQLLDSESEMTSVMSASGIGCDIDSVPPLENDDVPPCDTKTETEIFKKVSSAGCGRACDWSADGGSAKTQTKINVNDTLMIVEILESSDLRGDGKGVKEKVNIMTKSDIANQNVAHFDFSSVSMSAPSFRYLNMYPLEDKVQAEIVKDEVASERKKYPNEEIFEMDDMKTPTKKPEDDLMNVSLNSYELLDYTLQNKINLKPEKGDEMHVSLSEEVNENLKISLANPSSEGGELQPVKEVQTPADEQIVFRRQRKKKSKSDTPKKRVSFHEDILNSTKIDDIHINHGFITIEPDVSMSFFQRGSRRKPDVIKGRYSWAAEGDAPYYESNNCEREVKSDIYVHTARLSSTSSSSSASISSSIDEEDTATSTEDSASKREPTQKLPKTSCLKKTKNRKFIDTNIVEEDVSLRRKKSESNLLDTNIFGSLKNILNFSTSVPLAERGVPEGQEDITVYSSSHDGTSKSRRSSGCYENCEMPAPIKKLGNLNVQLAKTNLKLTKSEGFYPNYPNTENLPTNILICDSNVYEHKGISYSYEYDNFQKTFEQQKPKSSTVYQMILKEFNIFKKKATEEPRNDSAEDFELLSSTPVNELPKVQQIEDIKSKTTPSKYSSSTKLDWSDNDTISDYTDSTNSKHLNSPKHKIHKQNHYALQNFKYETPEPKTDVDLQSCKSLPNLRSSSSSSKNSLINRFLRNVTIKKMMDLKQQKKEKCACKYLGLYVKGVKVKKEINDCIDQQLEEEIVSGRNRKPSSESFDSMLANRFSNEVFREKNEKLIKVFPVHNAYTTNGENTSLIIILTDTTFYVSGHKSNNSYCNHFVLPYKELNTILIGPNAQTMHVSNYDKDMQCILTTGCANVTGDIVGQLEIAMRRDRNKPRLPAVKQLTMRDMINLRRSIYKQTSVDQDEEYFYYSIVKLQEYNTETQDTPLGPNKEGPLMFKISENESRWETAYFILKAGVLYMLSSSSHRVPMRVLPLINGACQGARRIFNYPRPHTFQILIGGTSLHLAAPDEYVASEWLQALVHAASGTYSNREKSIAQTCSLLMTSDHILTVREAFPCRITSITTKSVHEPIKGAQALSCAAISDITAFRLPSAEHSWCILEFACREVHESSGDWILYFSSNAELENFISTLEMLWAYHNEQGDSFPLSTIPETDPINRRCADTYNALQSSWSFLPHLVKYSY